jgi:hypothetical protein
MSTPYYGAPLMEGNDPYNMTTVYRWHIPDPVMFDKSLRVEIEHKGVTFNPDGTVKSGFEERADDFSSVAFWYQTEPHQQYPEMPRGYDRLYYKYSAPIEAEAAIPRAKASAGPVDAQEGGQWSGNNQLFWRPEQPDQALTLPIEIKEPGNSMLVLALTRSWDYGIYRFALDGKDLGRPVDLYNPSAISREQALGPVTLDPGQHTLTITNVGKNPESKGYFFGLDAIYLGK